MDDILKAVPVDEIAKKLGVSPDVAKQAIEQAGGTLLSGLAKNAESESGSAAIQKALGKHEGFTAASSVDDIDTADGKKILGHIFGGKENDVADTLNKSDQTAGGIDFAALLPMLAPIVMGLIANNSKGASGSESASSESGGGIGDLVGGLIGGGNSGGGGFDLGGIIGGLMGGGNSGGGGLDIGGLIGGFLGGKK